MGSWSAKMKTWSREFITDKFPDLHKCKEHGVRPHIIKIVAGKRKETHYVASCPYDDACDKITMEGNIGEIWNKYNPITEVFPKINTKAGTGSSVQI